MKNNLENIGIKKSNVIQNKKNNVNVNDNQIKKQSSTRTVDMYVAPDTSKSKLLKDFSGIINKFGEVGYEFGTNSSIKSNEDFVNQAEVDSIENEKPLTEEELRKKTKNSYFGDYQNYLDTFEKNKASMKSQEDAHNIAVKVNDKYDDTEKVEKYKEEFNKKINDIKNRRERGDITLSQYKNYLKSYTSEKEKYLNKFETMDHNRIQSDLKSEKKLILRSNDTIKNKINKLVKKGDSYKKAKKLVEDNFIETETNRYFNTEINGIDKTIDKEISSKGEENAVEIANNIYDEKIDNIEKYGKSRGWDSHHIEIVQDKFIKNKENIISKYRKRQEKEETAINIQNLSIKIDEGLKDGDFDLNEGQSSFDNFIHSDINNKNTTAKSDNYVRTITDKAIQYDNLKLLNTLSEIKGTSGKNLGEIYKDDIKKAKDSINNSLTAKNKISAQKLIANEKNIYNDNMNSKIDKFIEIEGRLPTNAELTNILKNTNSKNNIAYGEWQYKAQIDHLENVVTKDISNKTIQMGLSVDAVERANIKNKYFNKEKLIENIKIQQNTEATKYFNAYKKGDIEEANIHLEVLASSVLKNDVKFESVAIENMLNTVYDKDTPMNVKINTLTQLKTFQNKGLNPEKLKDDENGINDYITLLNKFNPKDNEKNIELAISFKKDQKKVEENYKKVTSGPENLELRNKINSYLKKFGYAESKKFKEMVKLVAYKYDTLDTKIVDSVYEKFYDEAHTVEEKFNNDIRTVNKSPVNLGKKFYKEKFEDTFERLEETTKHKFEIKSTANKNGETVISLFDRNSKNKLYKDPVFVFKTQAEFNDIINHINENKKKNKNIRYQNMMYDLEHDYFLVDDKTGLSQWDIDNNKWRKPHDVTDKKKNKVNLNMSYKDRLKIIEEEKNNNKGK